MKGNLSAVTNLTVIKEDFTVHLTWIAPFSFDLPLNGPDITYCVDVVNIGSTFISLLHSECGLVNTEFNFTIKPNDLNYLNFTVTPVNVVGNGTQKWTLFSIVPERK